MHHKQLQRLHSRSLRPGTVASWWRRTHDALRHARRVEQAHRREVLALGIGPLDRRQAVEVGLGEQEHRLGPRRREPAAGNLMNAVRRILPPFPLSLSSLPPSFRSLPLAARRRPRDNSNERPVGPPPKARAHRPMDGPPPRSKERPSGSSAHTTDVLRNIWCVLFGPSFILRTHRGTFWSMASAPGPGRRARARDACLVRPSQQAPLLLHPRHDEPEPNDGLDSLFADEMRRSTRKRRNAVKSTCSRSSGIKSWGSFPPKTHNREKERTPSHPRQRVRSWSRTAHQPSYGPQECVGAKP